MADLRYDETPDGDIRFQESGHSYRRRTLARGHPAIMLTADGVVVHAERLDLFDVRARRSFAAQVGEHAPPAVVEAELCRFSPDTAPEVFGQAAPAGLRRRYTNLT